MHNSHTLNARHRSFVIVSFRSVRVVSTLNTWTGLAHYFIRASCIQPKRYPGNCFWLRTVLYSISKPNMVCIVLPLLCECNGRASQKPHFDRAD